MINSVKRSLRNVAVLMAALSLSLIVHADEEAAVADETTSGGRAMAITVEAVVTDIDLETRHVTLQGPAGESFTLTATEEVVKLENVKVGDKLRATYISALEGELREPTEEELAEPWVVLEDGGKGVVDGVPMAGGARVIRAVCTIEGMNRLLGTVTILDPNGRAHVIADVEPQKMTGVTLGQTIVQPADPASASRLSTQATTSTVARPARRSSNRAPTSLTSRLISSVLAPWPAAICTKPAAG